jgi:ankyrin repeat protein
VGGKYGSALQAASIEGNLDICRLLLKNGADVNATGGVHGSALQAASANSCVAVVRLLLEKGADVNVFSGSALKAAARLGRLHPNKASKADKRHSLLPIDFNHGNTAQSSVDSGPWHTCVVPHKN